MLRRQCRRAGPAACGQPAQFALFPLGALSRWDKRRPDRSSSLCPEAGGQQYGMGRRSCRAPDLGARSSDPAFSAGRAGVTASAEGLRRGALACPWEDGRQPPRPGGHRRSPSPVRDSRTPREVLEAATDHSTPGSVCRQANSLAFQGSGLRQGGRAAGKRLPNSLEAEVAAPLTPRAPPRVPGSLSSISANPHAPQVGGGRPRPRIYTFSSPPHYIRS